MWQANQGRLSRWRLDRPGAVWRADRGHGGLPVALPALARRSSGRVDGGSASPSPSVPATVARMKAQKPRSRSLRPGVVEVIRDLCEIGAGQAAMDEDRSLRVRRADPSLGCTSPRVPWLTWLPGLGFGRGSLLDGVAGIVVARPRGSRTCGPMQGVDHASVQRPSPSRVASPDRDREGRLGAQGKGCSAVPATRQTSPGSGAWRSTSLVAFRRWWDASSLLSGPGPRRREPANLLLRPRKRATTSSPTSPCPSPTIRDKQKIVPIRGASAFILEHQPVKA